jgi:hypothetical protein
VKVGVFVINDPLKIVLKVNLILFLFSYVKKTKRNILFGDCNKKSPFKLKKSGEIFTILVLILFFAKKMYIFSH